MQDTSEPIGDGWSPTDTVEASSCRIVLVADPNPDLRESIKLLLPLQLGPGRVKVTTAGTGPEALELARACRPAVILLELCLPCIDGFEVARRLREQPETQATLVAHTGLSGASYKGRAVEAGFAFYLVKPVDPILLGTLLEALLRQPVGRTTGQPPRSPGPSRSRRARSEHEGG